MLHAGIGRAKSCGPRAGAGGLRAAPGPPWHSPRDGAAPANAGERPPAEDIPPWTWGPLLERVAALAHDHPDVCREALLALAASPSMAQADVDVETQAAVAAQVERCVGFHAPQSKEEHRPWGDSVTTQAPNTPISEGSTGSGEPSADEETARLPWFPPAGLRGGIGRRLFMLFDDADASIASKLIAYFVLLTIGVSIVSYLVESIPRFRRRPDACAELQAAGLPLTAVACEPVPFEQFAIVEAVCVVIFTVDYVVRVATAHTARDPAKTGRLCATAAYMMQPLAVVDAVAILPFYVDFLARGEMAQIAKLLRLCRILRLGKLLGRSAMVKLYWEVLVMSGEPLLVVCFLNAIVVVLFGCLIYFVEGQQYSVDESLLSRFPTGVYATLDPHEIELTPTAFRSIPVSVWWVCTTVTTVGYGDMSPYTPLGKAVGVTCFYVGIMFLALPISIIGSNFNIVYQRVLDGSSRVLPRWMSQRSSFLERSVSRRGALMSTFGAWLPITSNFRRSTFLVLDVPASCGLAKFVSLAMMATILVSTLVLLLESLPDFAVTPPLCVELPVPTVEACRPRPHYLFDVIETVCVIAFTVEYLLRLAVVHAARPADCGVHDRYDKRPLATTLAYIRKPMNIVDAVAILPFYASLLGIGGGGASVLRVLRLVRIFRVLKMPKMRSCADMFLDVGCDAMPAMLILTVTSMLSSVLFGSCIYLAEGTNYSVDPQVLVEHPQGAYIRPTIDGHDIEVSPFTSIPFSLWWFFTTAMTVGYGDLYPTTTMGRVVGIFVFATGIIMLAMPITIVGGSFEKYYDVWVEAFGPSKGAQDVETEPGDEADALSGAAPAGSPKLAWMS